MPLLLLILLLITTPVWATTRYVSTTGSDSNSCGASATITTPKRNLTGSAGAVACMSGGDTLYLRSGTYLEGIDNTFGGTGTVLPSGSSWGSPTTVAAYPGETVTLRPPGASYFRVIFMRSGEQYIIIDRLILDGSNIIAQVVDIGYPDSPAPHHIRLSNVEVHGGANTENRDGIHVGSGAHHFELLNSRIHHVGGTIEGTPQEHGLYLSAPDSLIDGNEIYNTSGFGLHMYLGTSPVNARNIVRNNKAHDNAAAGLLIGSGSDVIAYNNVSYNNTYEGIVLGFNMTTAGVYNNVAYGNTGAGLSISGSSTGVNARNNIIYGNGSQISDSGIGTVFDQNLCGSAGTGCEVIGDPGFVSAVGGDYHLALVSSPAVGAGVNLSSIFTTDADGLPRPASAPWAIGAYEFNPPSSSTDYRLQATSPLRNAALCLASVPLDIVGYTRGSSCDMGAYEFQSGEATGTVAKYLFSEGSGITVADSSGRGHTGTFAPDAGWTTGRIGPYAGIFDGTRYVTIPGVSELRPTTQATLAGWFKATSTSVAGGNIVDLPNGAMSLYLNSAGRLVCQAFDGTNYPSITSGATYFDDAWRFASCSYLQGDGLYLRVNHIQVGFLSLSIVLNYQGYLGGGGTGNVEIGRSSQVSTLGFIGSIDQVTVKDTACDTACDLALFQEGMSQRRIMVMGVR